MYGASKQAKAFHSWSRNCQYAGPVSTRPIGGVWSRAGLTFAKKQIGQRMSLRGAAEMTKLMENIVLTAAMVISPALASAQDIIPPKVYTMTPGGVSLADGSFTFTETDLVIGDLKLERFHLGGRKDPNDPFFGVRMSHNYDIYVAPNYKTNCAETICTTYKKPIVHMGTSASGSYYETLPPYVNISLSNEDALSGTLVYNSAGAYVFTNQAGDVYTFSTTVAAAGTTSASRRVANIVFADGQRQDFIYDGAGKLKAVIDSSGYALVFDYGANGRVSAACGYSLANSFVSVASTCNGATLKVSYGYSAGSPPKLTSVTDVSGGVTSYSYDRNEIACVTPPGYASCKISNIYASTSYPWQVTQQTLAGASVWRFQYHGDYLKPRDPDAVVDVEPQTWASVTDPAGKVSTYAFAQTSPLSQVDPDGRATAYKFRGGWDFYSSPELSQNHGSKMVEATLPEGNKYLASYGVRRALSKETFQAKPGSGLPDLIKVYGLPANCDSPYTPQNCAKPRWIKDPKGNQTDFEYAAHGGVLSEMQPAPSAGMARPLKLYAYAQRSAFIKNASGVLVPASAPIWMLTAETQCQTAPGSSAPVCDGSAPQVLTTYEYGPDGTADNLLVRGKVVSSGGTALRTCYGYDWAGNRIRETSPRAGLSTCQ